MRERPPENEPPIFSKEERRIQREAAVQAEKKRVDREAEKNRIRELRQQPVERIRRPGEGLDARQVFGDYYTGDNEFDRLAKSFNRERPKPEQFTDVYQKQKITGDLTAVERFKMSPKYREERGPEAIASEYVVQEIIRRGVLGKNVRSKKTSEPDDFLNHSDLVVAVDEQDGTSEYLAVDVTTSQNPEDYKRKLAQTIDGLEENTLNQVEYFVDEKHPEVKGRIELPRVVLSLKDVKDLQRGLASDSRYEPPIEVEAEMLEEITLQLSQSTAFLLTEHFRAGEQFELEGNDPEAVLNFFHEHGLALKRQDPQLYTNVNKHVQLLGHFILQKEAKGPAQISGGPLWKLVHEGRVY